MIPSRRRILSYAGGHDDKQAARIFLYKKVLAAPVQGHAITLAGTDPDSEVSLLRDYVKWPAHRTWFVDNSKRPEVLTALTRIERHWPDANVCRANVWNVAPKLEALGFANLDFMGAPLHAEIVQCLHRVTDLLLPGAIMGFTWMRGRESLERPSARLLWNLGKGFRGNERRWAGMLCAIDDISNGSLELIGKWEYLSNHSPMSVAVFRKD